MEVRMKKALNAIGNYFKNIGIAFVKGDVWVKLSADGRGLHGQKTGD